MLFITGVKICGEVHDLSVYNKMFAEQRVLRSLCRIGIVQNTAVMF